MPAGLLRAALLLDELAVPAWACEAIHRAGGHARWLGIIVTDSSPKHEGLLRQLDLRRLSRRRQTALATAYVKLDQLVSPADRDPLVRRDLEMLEDVPRLELNAENMAKIEAMSLDVIVSFSSRPPEQLAAAAKLGVWSVRHDVDLGQAKLAGLAAVVENHDVNRATLVMQRRGQRELTLAELCTAVDRLSAARNRSNLYWPAAALLPRQLERLHRLGAEQFLAEAESRHEQVLNHLPADGVGRHEETDGDRQPPFGLTNRRLLPGLLRLGARRLKRKWTKQVCRDQWFLLSHFEAATTTPSTKIENFQEIVPPIDRFWADPNVFCYGGKPYVFFEEYLYATGKAHISVMEFNEQGRWHSAQPVLERPYHLSYPFLFNWQGRQYMIPETSANRTLEVYRCDEFPDRWSLHKTLMTGINAFDATLVEVAGHWWMFVTLAENGGSSWDELFLFHADHPLSDHWLPHPMNPIVSDVRRARPAGPVFVKDGQLYRPAQDCSRTYGYGLRLHRIDEISPTKYAETEVQFIEPLASRGWLATHTLSSAGGLTMIDAQRRRWKFSGRSSQPVVGTAESPRRGEEIGASG